MDSSVYEYQPSFILGFHGCDKEVGDLLNQSRYSCMDELVAAIRELPEDSYLQDVLQDFGRLANARK